MQEGKLKPLYLATNIQELKQHFDIPDGRSPKMLCKVMPKLLKQAEDFRLAGDEEKSYISYMRYLSVVQCIKSSKDYSENSDFYGQIISKANVIAALNTAEKLSSSLQDRYKLLSEQKTQDLVLKEKERKDAELEQRRRQQEEIMPMPANEDIISRTAENSDVSIACTELYSLLKRPNSNILVLDARPAFNYLESHIKMSDCIISVPQDIIKPGVSASALERSLPANSKAKWKQRGLVDMVVLLDWSTTTRTLTPGSNLYTLKNILLKWDPDIIYKKEPLILEGGYEDWLLRYPAYTTNSRVEPPNNFKENFETGLLDSIEYNTLMESLQPAAGDRPGVDRRSKAAAIQAYEERSQLVKHLLNNTENVTNDALQLEKRRLQAEEEWEQVRLRREKEAEEEMKLQLQNREEELLRSIEVLERLQKEKEYENQCLRNELDEFKKKHSEDVLPKGTTAKSLRDEEEINARIRMKEKERHMIAAKRELKHKERERRVEEERKGDIGKLHEKNNASWDHAERERQARQNLDRMREERRLNQDKIIQEKQEYEQKIRGQLRQESEKENEDQLKLEQIKSEILKKTKQGTTQSDESVIKLHERPEQEKHNPEGLHDYEHAVLEHHEHERLARENQEDEQLAHDMNQCERVARQVRDSKEEEKLSWEKQARIRPDKEKAAKEKEKGMYYTHLKDMPGSSTIKRSHSSPNIAQLDDEDVNIRQKVPQFDRTIKPLNKPQPSEIHAARQRNFNPVYGSLGRGLTGLKNLGNTCYMNSVMQCLNNTTPLASYFCGGDYREDINRQTETRGEVAEEVAAVIRALWSGQYRSIAIRDLRNVVGQHRDQFQTTQQQDSNEFLTILMDWLHEDLKKQIGICPIKESSETSEWEKHWNLFYKDNTSLIVTLFYGQQKSTVRCLRCNEESVRFETFSNLTLPLPSNYNRCSLEDCMRLYLKGEKITGWKCPACKELRDASKKFDILKLPPILIIHFKRFYMDGWCRKRQTFVDFPLRDLDMKCHTVLPDQRYTNYNLYGVSNHYGTMDGGHYTAYCKSTVYHKWFKFDDQEVSELSSADVKSGAAYILFYASIEYNVPDVS